MSRLRVIAASAALLLVVGFVAANAHLVSVAIGSQPDCVLNEANEEGAASRAAKPSC
jgi:hypothetical protein